MPLLTSRATMDQGHDQNFPPVLPAEASEAAATEDNPNHQRAPSDVDEEKESGTAAKAVNDSRVSGLAWPDGPVAARVVYVNEDALSRRALRGLRVLRIAEKIE